MATAGETLDELIRRFHELPEAQRKEIKAAAIKATDKKKFAVNPGPQSQAYFSEADEVFYGGAAGGGKSALVCGLAINDHRRSLILRREYPQIKGLEDEVAKVLGTREGYNAQDKVWKLDDKRRLEFGSVTHEKDKEKYQGRAHDLKAFDEVTQFTESMYRYIIGWNRSDSKSQRCRVVATGNPPLSAEGAWVISYWGPWLDPHHPNPAKPGELRWYTTIDGKDVECAGSDPVIVNGLPVQPRSRTFISSSLEDNPDLLETGYAAVIEAMPEPLRTMLREGRFDVTQQDDEWQVVPSEWVRLAQGRWQKDAWKGLKMTTMGVDVAQGGADQTVLSARYGAWFAPIESFPGVETPDPSTVAGLITTRRRHGALIVVDVGGGYGGGVLNYLKDNDIAAVGFNAAAGSARKTQDGQLGFVNKRAEAWWRFREALDPGQEGGSPIALPPDAQLVADLTAPRWKMVSRGIQIEEKDKIRERIGRSTDKGDAVVMGWAEGQANAERKVRGAFSKYTPKVVSTFRTSQLRH